jgi:hypothetical protein
VFGLDMVALDDAAQKPLSQMIALHRFAAALAPEKPPAKRRRR